MVRNAQIAHYMEVPRPIVALGNDYSSGHAVKPHSHRRGQLLYGDAGVVMVTTPDGTLVMPPERGLWIPPGVTHSVRMLGAVKIRSLYLEPAATDALPDRCEVVEIAPLLRQLIAEAVDLPVEYDFDGRSGALMTLLLHELARMTPLPLTLPMPSHALLLERCRAFLLEPTTHETIDQWADGLHMSRRAFTRIFRKQTGLSFVEWRQQACLLAAMPRLVQGEAVTAIALDLGYKNPAAFSSMFRRTFGHAPRDITRRS